MNVEPPDWAQGRLRAYWAAGLHEDVSRRTVATVDEYAAKDYPLMDEIMIRVLTSGIEDFLKRTRLAEIVVPVGKCTSVGGPKGRDGDS